MKSPETYHEEMRRKLAMSAPVSLDDVPDLKNWQARGSIATAEKVPIEERLAELARLRLVYADAMLAAMEGKP